MKLGSAEESNAAAALGFPERWGHNCGLDGIDAGMRKLDEQADLCGWLQERFGVAAAADSTVAATCAWLRAPSADGSGVLQIPHPHLATQITDRLHLDYAAGKEAIRGFVVQQLPGPERRIDTKQRHHQQQNHHK